MSRKDLSVDTSVLYKMCSELYSLSERILRLPETAKDAIVQEMETLSKDTIEQGRKLMCEAARLSALAPEQAATIYSITDTATTSVLNAINIVGTIAQIKSVQKILKKALVTKTNPGTVN